ncbi:MAG TPA: choice-of-anchor tandem repeat GloVer-containing protein, partial [Candidatus Cybelea sp.]
MNRYTLNIAAFAALLSGCSGSQPPIGAPGAMPQTRPFAARGDSSSFKVVYSFGGSADGSRPTASLIDVNATLYGTTESGGAYGQGTVFSITPSGKEKVLHSFGHGTDGSGPLASLIEVKGTLYGTTATGGKHGAGTVFSVTPSGTEKVLHTFSGGRGGSDGAFPAASLIEVKGKLYGTTRAGGTYAGSYYEGCGYGGNSGCGTVYSIMPSGKERVLHSFGNGIDEGASPLASLIEVNGELYGTTMGGGKTGQGTVFTITLNGNEKVLHSFGPGNGTDGGSPFASMIEGKGTLYGTTEFGGSSKTTSGGCYYVSICGTIFSITPSGTEKLLHSFGNGTDGSGPLASLIEVKGKLYGTTAYGGAYYHNGDAGTVFNITINGTEKVLHSFGNGT